MQVLEYLKKSGVKYEVEGAQADVQRTANGGG